MAATVNSFLQASRAALKAACNGGLSSAKQIVLVIGNESADLDSIVSAIVGARFLSSSDTVGLFLYVYNYLVAIPIFVSVRL